MAKVKTKTSSVKVFQVKPKRRRPGIVSKKKSSKLKSSKNYRKLYKGQGK